MDYNNIKKLLDLYFEGETTLEQEKSLNLYFQQEDIHPELQKFQALFQFFRLEQSQQLDQSFDERLLQQLENLEAESERPKLRILPYLARIAAVITICLGSWWAYELSSTEVVAEEPQAIDWSKYEPKTEQEAYEITKMALLTASSKLNKGTSQAVQEFVKIDEVGKFFK